MYIIVTRRRPRYAVALSALSLIIISAGTLPAQSPTPLRDPALPYGSWGEAAREAADAIGGRPLAKPADGIYAVGDAVIFDDSGKRYRTHVIAIANGRYELHYDGFGPNWKIPADADAVLGYQPGYAPPSRSASIGRGAASSWQVGDELEAESGGKWYSARVIGVRGGSFRVHYDGQPSSKDEWMPSSRLRRFPGAQVRTTRAEPGKYACNASSYNSRTGMYEYPPKGAFVLASDGSYSYLGFAQPSRGRYRVSEAGTVTFAGGHLDGGEATPIVQRRGRYYLTAPRIGERWTCSAGAK